MEDKSNPVPRLASTIAIWLFLVSLGVLFFASMLGYILIRVNNREVQAMGTIVLPKSFYVSTLLMLISSFTIHQALNAIRFEKHDKFKIFLIATIVFACAFVIVQTPAMLSLWHQQQAVSAQWQATRELTPPVLPPPTPGLGDETIYANRSIPFYGLIMCLILLHAAHVVGGLVALGLITYNGYKNRYDHEQYSGVRNCVLYWHFLDAVWIVMFLVIAAFG